MGYLSTHSPRAHFHHRLLIQWCSCLWGCKVLGGHGWWSQIHQSDQHSSHCWLHARDWLDEWHAQPRILPWSCFCYTMVHSPMQHECHHCHLIQLHPGEKWSICAHLHFDLLTIMTSPCPCPHLCYAYCTFARLPTCSCIAWRTPYMLGNCSIIVNLLLSSTFCL